MISIYVIKQELKAIHAGALSNKKSRHTLRSQRYHHVADGNEPQGGKKDVEDLCQPGWNSKLCPDRGVVWLFEEDQEGERHEQNQGHRPKGNCHRRVVEEHVQEQHGGGGNEGEGDADKGVKRRSVVREGKQLEERTSTKEKSVCQEVGGQTWPITSL